MECRECKVKIEDGNEVILGNSKFCSGCASKIEESDRQQLIATIIKLYNIPQPTGFMFSQIKRFREEGMHYRNIRMTLEYMVHVLHFKMNPKYGIASVRNHHDDMIKYQKARSKKALSNRNINYEVKEIITSKPDMVHMQYNKQKLINMEEKYGKQ